MPVFRLGNSPRRSRRRLRLPKDDDWNPPEGPIEPSRMDVRSPSTFEWPLFGLGIALIVLGFAFLAPAFGWISSFKAGAGPLVGPVMFLFGSVIAAAPFVRKRRLERMRRLAASDEDLPAVIEDSDDGAIGVAYPFMAFAGFSMLGIWALVPEAASWGAGQITSVAAIVVFGVFFAVVGIIGSSMRALSSWKIRRLEEAAAEEDFWLVGER